MKEPIFTREAKFRIRREKERGNHTIWGEITIKWGNEDEKDDIDTPFTITLPYDSDLSSIKPKDFTLERLLRFGNAKNILCWKLSAKSKDEKERILFSYLSNGFWG